ncbi:hypothetical protein BC832DRAFT_398343 [Gaertneriomyces semiglobifer]|nr:hypothetical protein BC832DRAFT_398343 [Gaertneriomyces semiglobifer]
MLATTEQDSATTTAIEGVKDASALKSAAAPATPTEEAVQTAENDHMAMDEEGDINPTNILPTRTRIHGSSNASTATTADTTDMHPYFAHLKAQGMDIDLDNEDDDDEFVPENLNASEEELEFESEADDMDADPADVDTAAHGNSGSPGMLGNAADNEQQQ